MKEFGMTTLQEQAYLEQYAHSIYCGRGEIVDLGCWLGATTISLAKGLSKNPNPCIVDKRIHAYDRFIWEEWMDSHVEFNELEQNRKPQDNFLADFIGRTAQWSPYINIHAGDISEIGWSGYDIEFLFIDAMKSWKLANSIISDFYPYLIMGRSYIVHQDFSHFYTSWIHMLTYRFRDYFTKVHDIPYSSSVVFKYTRPLPNDMLTMVYSSTSFSSEEIDAAFYYSMQLVSTEKRANIAAAKVMLFLHQEDKERAMYELNSYLSQGFSLQSELSVVKDMLDSIKNV